MATRVFQFTTSAAPHPKKERVQKYHFSENEGEEREAERIDAGHSASETAMEVLNKGGTAEEEISKASLS